MESGQLVLSLRIGAGSMPCSSRMFLTVWWLRPVPQRVDRAGNATVEVTIDVFSGRPNPSWILTPDEEVELESRIALATPLQPMANLREDERLGYRGLIVNRGQSE